MKKEKPGEQAAGGSGGTHTQVSVRFPNELLKRIEGYANAERRSRNNAIEHLLWQSFRENR